MDPALADYPVSSAHDDQAGVMMTYTMGFKRPRVSHALRSTGMFITIVNAMIAGALGALIANASGAGPVWASTTGALAGRGCTPILRPRGRVRTRALFPL
jgi:hypothetical protein